ncbi:recombinase family protein [Xiamenia xianingshaonis]|uniref:Recombinase family protein n=2 Tax=Xiamenia xianingshaonis TaxID=2682776 RepID=A0A9E6SVB5_9ACTN|nr:recombinase family protein [Xiamenia xianingshaonis]NHM14146.1 recombinase family protein [Xiamenia xianingshaonis]QTU85254.1 recombinase family protein [Xiamenia xianingshaonis]
MSEYGYARVSSKDQNLNRQMDALKEAGLDEGAIYADKASGKDFERPAYKRMLKTLARGDVLYVKSIDRLGRNYNEIIEEWRFITKGKQAHIVVLDMPLLDTRQSVGGITGVLITDLVLQLLSYVAQIERENIKQRQAEGIAAAKVRGVRFGRPKKRRPDSYGEVSEAYLRKAITRSVAAARLDVSPSTFDLWLKQDGYR